MCCKNKIVVKCLYIYFFDFDFDVVISNYTLQFVRPINRENLLSKIYNSLPKNGIFILVFFLVIGIQLIFANFGGRAVRTHILRWKLQLFSIGIGALTLIVNLIGKSIIEDDETLNEDEVQRKKSKKINFIVNRLTEKKLLKNSLLSSRKKDNNNISIKVNQ